MGMLEAILEKRETDKQVRVEETVGADAREQTEAAGVRRGKSE